jgi:hypothetical protein
MIEIVYSNCWVGSIMWIVDDVGAPPPSPVGNFSSLPPLVVIPLMFPYEVQIQAVIVFINPSEIF